MVPDYSKTGTNMFMCKECGCTIGPLPSARSIHNEWHQRLEKETK